MSTFVKEISLSTKGETDIVNITEEVSKIVQSSKIKDGQALVYVLGSTASISIIEYEPGLVKDLKDMFERIIPRDGTYAHHTKWGDNNGSAHIRASLIGSSQSFPLIDGKLVIGTWQQIILVDFDTKPRDRKVIVSIVS